MSDLSPQSGAKRTFAVTNRDFLSTHPKSPWTAPGAGQAPGFLKQKYFGVARIYREGTRPVHRPAGLPPPEGSALGGQNISILNVCTHNSDSSSSHRTLRTFRCALPSLQHSLPLDIYRR